MNPHELFLAGQLGDAVEAQTAVVRAQPGDAGARYQLFVLFCFTGQLDRARLALGALGTSKDWPEVHTLLLRSLLLAEEERTTVLSVEGTPLLPPGCPSHVQARLEALSAMRQKDTQALAKALDEAGESTPAMRGEINGEPFEIVRDDDDLLGSVLEVFAAGRYVWLPFEQIASLQLAEPETAVDLLWAPASLTTHDGTEASIYIPALYQGSHSSDDDTLRLGRTTHWEDIGDDVFRGRGQRILRAAAGDTVRDWPMLEVRTLRTLAEASA